jgi:DNA-directed RNA polymerase II subunit RPB2
MEDAFANKIVAAFTKANSPSAYLTDNYDSFTRSKLPELLWSLKPLKCVHFTPDGGERNLNVTIVNHKLLSPMVVEPDFTSRPILPYECRIRNITYSGPLYVDLKVEVKWKNKVRSDVLKDVYLGRIPCMIYSSLCHVKDPKKRVKYKECEQDPGGYFIIGGREKALVTQTGGKINRTFRYITKKNNMIKTCAITCTSEKLHRMYTTTVKWDSSKKPVGITFPRLENEVPVMTLLIALGITVEEIKSTFTSDELNLLHSSFNSLPSDVEEAKQRVVIREVYNLENTKEEGLHRAFTNMMVPHIPLNKEGNKYTDKACFILKMIKELLQVYTGKLPPTDRDSLINQRMHSSYTLLSSLFLQLLISWSENVKKEFNKLITKYKKPITNDKIRQVISNNNTITDGFVYALATGTFNTKNVNKKQLKGVSQQLARKSHMDTVSQLRRISSSIDAEMNKNPLPRFLHGTHFGRLCPAETPEGKSVGIEKTMAVAAYISLETDPKPIYDVIKQYLLKISIKSMEKGSDVYINGIYVGNTTKQNELVHTVRAGRRSGQFEKDISVSYYNNTIHVSTTSGRLCRPLMIIENGELNYKGTEDMDWHQLLQRGYVEYLDAEEESTCLVAFFPKDITHKHTHCEIKNALMNGINAASIPFSNKNPAPRNCFQSAMAKQAQGVYALNYQHRYDTTNNVLYYQHKPLCETYLSKQLHVHDSPHGLNAVVAIMPFEYNQEDSIIVNEAFIQRGGFRADHYTTVESIAASNTKEKATFCKPVRKRKLGKYDKLDNDGIINPGYEIEEKDCVIGKKFIRHQYKDTSQNFFEEDQSVLSDKRGYVESTKLFQDRKGNRATKIKIRTRQIPTVGDKFSSRHGQKGTIGMIFPTVDMPHNMFTGMTPDIIVNPCAIPSRMTIGHIMEMLTGKAIALSAEFIDSSPFNGVKIEDVGKILKAYGFHSKGNECLLSGPTGEMLKCPIFMGPIFYQRLKHMVDYKWYARRQGKKNALTKQPNQGRAGGGGLRFGEMEKDTVLAHACPRQAQDRMLYNSDYHQLYVCVKCKQPSLKEGCKVCGSETKEVEVPYAKSLLLQELKAMCINSKLNTH